MLSEDIEESNTNNNQNASQNCLSTINCLNEDCLIEIFQYLCIIDRIIVERVCKKWNEAAKKSWKKFKTFDFNAKTWGINHIKRPIQIDEDAVKEVVERSGYSIKSFDFRHAKEVCKGSLVTVAKLCPNLQTISITESVISPLALNILAKNCKNLTSFTAELGNGSNVNGDELSALFKNNKSLRRVELSSIYIDGKFFLSLSPETIREIILIHVELPFFSDEFVKAISSFKNLQKLRINIIASFLPRKYNLRGKNVLRAINSCSSTLQIFGLNCFNYNLDYQYFVHFSNLKELNISHCVFVTDNFLIAITKYCRKLTKVDISFCYDTTNEGVGHVTKLPELEELYIDYLVKISDEILIHMSNLKILRCRDCPLIKNKGLCSLILIAKNLQLLDVRECQNITNELIEFAIQTTKLRNNKKSLKLIVNGTSVNIDKISNNSPFLEIVNKEFK